MTPVFHDPPGLLALATLVRDCSVSGVGRQVLLLRTDLLPPRLSRPHHLRLAEDALEPMSRADRATSYALAHGRMALSWRGAADGLLADALGRLEHLLRDAPLDAPAISELARVFVLPLDGAALLAVASCPTPAEQVILDSIPPADPPAPLPPLDAGMLDEIEARLSQANVARFARRRTVCRLGLKAFTPAWESRFLSLDALMAELTPDHDAFADPWLLRRLSRMADRRLMALLSASPELRSAGPFSLMLSVATVLSPEFLRFDGALPPGLRGQALLDLQPGDVTGDFAAFRFARTFARARGYKVVLRDVTRMAMEVLDLAELDFDFLELAWTPALAGLDAALLQAGTARWVLTAADEAAAVDWGRSVGIGLFQGAAAAAGAGHGTGRRPA